MHQRFPFDDCLRLNLAQSCLRRYDWIPRGQRMSCRIAPPKFSYPRPAQLVGVPDCQFLGGCCMPSKRWQKLGHDSHGPIHEAFEDPKFQFPCPSSPSHVHVAPSTQDRRTVRSSAVRRHGPRQAVLLAISDASTERLVGHAWTPWPRDVWTSWTRSDVGL